MRDWWLGDWIALGGGVFIAALIAVFIVASIHDEHQWQVFSAAHHCKLVGSIDSSVGTGTTVTANGNVGVTTVYVPGKSGFQCDDGVTYWR